MAVRPEIQLTTLVLMYIVCVYNYEMLSKCVHYQQLKQLLSNIHNIYGLPVLVWVDILYLYDRLTQVWVDILYLYDRLSQVWVDIVPV